MHLIAIISERRLQPYAEDAMYSKGTVGHQNPQERRAWYIPRRAVLARISA
jgi:hypothetical protein